MWLRETNVKTSETADQIWLYTVKEGAGKVVNIHDPLRRMEIKEQLCTTFATIHGETDPGVCAEVRQALHRR